MPKESSDYNNRLISKWSENEIKEHIESVATQSKNQLSISARDFKSPSYGDGAGAFDCRFFKYDFTVAQSEEDFSKCLFTGVLEIESLDSFNEIQDAIDNCFDFKFDKVICNLPKGERDLKELIYSLDDNKDQLSVAFDFSYENDFSAFHLVHKKDGRVITVNNNEIEIKFRASESIPDMIKALQEVNKNIFSATAKEYNLLSD